ncbi:hypothetical protein MCOR06_002181 [Pyricularia oryzae]|uniref:Asl1-like glycosyl hydrolase catalytic domain-containing protein n=1 Tax=Pyricularia oryzae TaxID=318829 RepID=A0A4P7NRY5_PYROR|nr:hypothetical protein MCOR06_002181 [Pyricularia oryzae]QBZ65205.1 hypothetical protein PoMZ_06912 [Pyricularia oryzae]
MLLPASLITLTALALAYAQTVRPNPKRGLVFVPEDATPRDNYIWTRPPTTLSWYYNYGPEPSVVFNNLTQDQFEFVPMLWGAPSDPEVARTDTKFAETVKDVIKKRGVNITHVMGFNEPDMAGEGMSNVRPDVAARVWVNNIVPLQEMGVKAGLPAPTASWDGIPWLRQFLGNCSNIISAGGESRNCTFDFVPIHWYGNFEGLASHIGTYAAAFPGKKIWVTEYNADHQDLAATQDFFKRSLEYMDRIDDVERYSLFGAFRAPTSNVGPNGAMLSAGGELTDIGAWYLGREAMGVAPSSTVGSAATEIQVGLRGWFAVVFAAVLVL